ETAAHDLLVRVRWPDGVCCPRCCSYEMTLLSTRPGWWQCRPCRKQTSVRSDTVLHGTRKPLRDWLLAIWRNSFPAGVSARSLAIELDYRYETMWVMLHKIRAALSEHGVWQLQGPATIAIAEISAPKRANGDPPGRPPVRVAVAVDEDPRPD